MTISNSLPLTLQAFRWNHLWRMGLSIAAWTIGVCASAELLGYWLHRLLHSGAIRVLSRNHMKHHLVLYGPLHRQRSDTYRDATDASMSLGNIGLEWLIPAGFLIAIVVAAFHLLRLSLFYQALSLGSALGWSFLMFSYLHDLMHEEGVWPAKHRRMKCWFLSARRLHDIHHRVLNDDGIMDKNFGIRFLLFDRLCGTLTLQQPPFNHRGYAVAREKFNCLKEQRAPATWLNTDGDSRTKEQRCSSRKQYTGDPMLMVRKNSCKSSIRNVSSRRELSRNLALVLAVAISIATIGQAQLSPIPRGSSASVPTQASKLAAKGADIKAAYQRGMAHVFGTTADHDYASAAEDLRQAATAGLADAQLALGNLYVRGLGVPQDYRLAMSYYRAAADQRNAQAANNIGALYEWGHGVPVDMSEAARWYGIAAELGDPTGQTNLAALYFYGEGVRRDYRQAACWSRKAALQGYAPGEVALANLYLLGKGVPKDYSEAVRWLRRAGEQGNAQAQASLANLYEQGKGVPLDYITAYRLYQRSIQGGNEESKSRIKNLLQIMTPQQIKEANTFDPRMK